MSKALAHGFGSGSPGSAEVPNFHVIVDRAPTSEVSVASLWTVALSSHWGQGKSRSLRRNLHTEPAAAEAASVVKRAYEFLHTTPQIQDRVAAIFVSSSLGDHVDPTEAYTAVRAYLADAKRARPEKLVLSFGQEVQECLAHWRTFDFEHALPPLDEGVLRIVDQIATPSPVVLDLEPTERRYVDQSGAPITPKMQDPQWRSDFARRITLWNAREATENLGRGGGNPAEYMRKLVERLKIFRLRYRGEWKYPAYQFDSNGDPLSAVATLIALSQASEGDDAWRLAHFLDQPNAYLTTAKPGVLGKLLSQQHTPRPSDLLRSQPDLVVKVAQKEFGSAVDVF